MLSLFRHGPPWFNCSNFTYYSVFITLLSLNNLVCLAVSSPETPRLWLPSYPPVPPSLLFHITVSFHSSPPLLVRNIHSFSFCPTVKSNSACTHSHSCNTQCTDDPTDHISTFAVNRHRCSQPTATCCSGLKTHNVHHERRSDKGSVACSERH